MDESGRIDVAIVTDPEALAEAYAVRREVFQREQGVPEDEEFDDDDERAVHVLARYDGDAAGTGRVVFHPTYAKIGRMAVHARFRRHHVGSAILTRLMDIARQHGATRFVLHAQVQAIPFYAALGFAITSDVFDEAGIPHRKMERPA